MLKYLVLGVTYGFAAGAQPGQLQAYLISRAVAHGWRRTIPAAFAPVFSDAPIILLVLLVLTHVPAGFLRALQACGGLFLLYLAWTTAAGARREATREHASAGETLFRATLLNLLNPNPYLAWSLVLGPLLLQAWQESAAGGVTLVAAFYLTMVAVSAGLVWLFAMTRSLGSRVSRIFLLVSAAALAVFGVYQLWAAIGLVVS